MNYSDKKKVKDIHTHSFPIDRKQNIFTCQLDDEFKMNKELMNTIRKSEYRYSVGRANTVKAYMTNWRMSTEPGFKRLKEITIGIADTLTKTQYNLKAGADITYDIIDMWGMIYKENDYTIVHDHWPALWSGIYYIKISETLKGGKLYFPELKKGIVPKERMLVMFDGYLKHGVEELHGKGERIVVSFNVTQ
jgi:hypothetical protein